MDKLRIAIAIAWTLFFPALSSGQTTSEPTKVRFSFNPVIHSYLPIFIAIDKGYFKEQNIDLQISVYNGSSVSQMPLAARGDLDIVPMVGGPALFNQQSGGFDIKVIASMVESRAGWHDGAWILVRKALWDAGTVRSVADLKGRSVDGGPDGSSISFMLNQALLGAGMTRADVKYSGRFTSPADWVAALANDAVDAFAAVEPFATQFEQRGLVARLVSSATIMPWFQESFFVASAKYVETNRDVVKRFLMAYVKAAREVDAAGGKWTPDQLAILAKWTRVPEATIGQIPGPQYYGQLGRVKVDSLIRQQDYWASIGQVKTKIDVASLVDATIIEEAIKETSPR